MPTGRPEKAGMSIEARRRCREGPPYVYSSLIEVYITTSGKFPQSYAGSMWCASV